jgi:hypothetical protein
MPMVCLDKQNPEVQPPLTIPSAALREDSGFGRWTRTCPLCQAELSKPHPWLYVVCQCGWQWES